MDAVSGGGHAVIGGGRSSRIIHKLTRAAPALVAVLVLPACSEAPNTAPRPAADPWPNELEEKLQNAEALRYELDRLEREQARLDALRVDGQAVPRR